MSRLLRVVRRVCHPSALLFIWLFGAASCQHPIDFTTSHIEVADIIIHPRHITDTTRLAYTVRNEHWEGGVPLTRGEDASLRFTLIDFKGIEIPLSTRDDLEIRMEAEHPRMVQWEPWTGDGILRSFATGTTRVRFLVWHGSHPDFITPWLTLEIQPPSSMIPD
jgi:hypothetical protein